MSNREIALNLINSFEESQLSNVISILQSAKTLADEAADDTFCLKLVEQYESDLDPQKKETIPILNLAKELGIDLH